MEIGSTGLGRMGAGMAERWVRGGHRTARWPALSTVPWFPAVGDGAVANIGSGCIGHERIALTVGTTGAMRAVERTVSRVPPGLWCYRVDGDHALLGGATSEGGNVYA